MKGSQSHTREASIGGSVALIDFNRSSPVRVRDLSIVSCSTPSAVGLNRFCSPVALTFYERSTRHKFVRNVFAVLTLQFCFITAMCMAAELVEPLRNWIQQHLIYGLITAAAMLVLVFSMACVRVLRIKFPVNVLMLFLFTQSLTILLMYISVYDKTFLTVMALGLITLVCFCVMLNAMQTRHSITTWGMFMYVAVQTVLIFAVGAAILLRFTPIRMKTMIYSVLIALTFCLYLAYDIQEILAGKRREVAPENVVLGVIKLYVDSLYIFCLFCYLCEQTNY